jgi:cellulose synthase (UDP-forming)
MTRVARVLLTLVATAVLIVATITPLGLRAQMVAGGSVFVIALVLRKRSASWVSQLLTLLSVAVSARYIWWRITATLDFDNALDGAFGTLLLLAELYAFVILLLGAFQTVGTLDRRPVKLGADRSRWPTVDVFIPTYNEPLDVVRPTLLAALSLDWPRDKLRVHLLDDGRRHAFQQLAEQANANYIVRADNDDAKAGNLNHALSLTSGELVVIFDCDHITTRSFLQLTVGWFVRDPKLAMLQTPHHFYNADPIERNMRLFRRMPNEGELFYGHVQSGNDLWNATFFCGSCAVIRRSALEEVGGIATESVTEDALTSIKLQRRGYGTAYLAIRQAGGLATDTLAAHIGQRVRWAQGMTQILRLSNPLLGRGLTFAQRLCYLNASLHFLYGLPRLVFLLAPLAYLLGGAHVCNAAPAMLLAYLLPHLGHAFISDSRTRSRFRHTLWNHVYETVLAIYILVPTLTALINPRASVFKVTDKGVRIETGGFDRRVARPYLILLLLSLPGIMFAAARLLLWDFFDVDTVVLNLSWLLFSAVMLGTALAIACETRQLRRSHRLPIRLPAMLRLASGHTCTGRTMDLSLGGGRLQVDGDPGLAAGDPVNLAIFVAHDESWFPAKVIASEAGSLRLAFAGLSLKDEAALVELLFGRPDAWVDWERGRPAHPALGSLRTLLRESRRGIARAAGAQRKLFAAAVISAVACAVCFLLSHTGWRLHPLVQRVTQIGVSVARHFQPETELR